MEIIFHGRHDSAQASESLLTIFKLFQERYRIEGFREMHLSVTLVDDQGVDVELVDTDTDEALRVFEVYCQVQDNLPAPRKKRPRLKLVTNKEGE